MRDYLPDLSASFGRERAAAGHDEWLTQDDPFQPLPVMDHMGVQLPDQPPLADDIILSDDELKLMLPMLLHDQGQLRLKEDDSLIYVQAVKNYTPATTTSLQSRASFVAPKNTRKDRPAKRPLDEVSACVRNERSLEISTLNSSEDLRQSKTGRIGLKNGMKNCDSSHLGTLPQIARLRETRGDTTLLLSDFFARQDGSNVKTATSKIRTPTTTDPLMYDVLQSYKTLNDRPTMSAENKKQRINLDLPLPQWHWHDSSVSMDVPSPRVVTRNDSNGTPQTYKIVYAAITMPYAVANKFDPVALYKSAKGAIESLIHHDNCAVNVMH